MEVMEDYRHLFIGTPPGYAQSEIVQIMKSISAKRELKKFPEVTEQLWGGGLWNDGHFVRSRGDKCYNRSHLKLYLKSAPETVVF
jgi:putative transposase